MRNEKADVVIVIVAILALFLSPRILAAGSSQQRSDFVVKYKTDKRGTATIIISCCM